ncbi:hypothetical protein ACGYLO_12575 [Sulfitobacter sp. 1A13353]|uniref:hypothetical protein n=1 Tax=Sulfitobacter sp. 1A13353 TaxID=3368568 RepID=UPI003746496F
MTKTTAKRKITALDIKKITSPTASSVAGQFMVLDDKVEIDDQTAIEVLGEDETIKVASGSTFCVYDTKDEGEVAPVKLHATQDVMLKGPLIWARLPTIDILPIISKPVEKTVFTTCEKVCFMSALGFLYAIGSAPFAVAAHIAFAGEESILAALVVILIALGTGAFLLFITDKIELFEAKAHEDGVSEKFKATMIFNTPDITSLTHAKKTAD